MSSITISLEPVKRLQQFSLWLLPPILVFSLSRAYLFIVGWFATHYLDERQAENFDFWHAVPENILIDIWARWDSGFYLDIINQGYSYILGEQSSVAFFPLYPLMVKALTIIFPNPVFAGMIISNLCFFAALLYLHKLISFEFGQDAAKRSLILLCLYPASFFFSAVYTESSFLLFSVQAFYYARTKRWGLASLAAMLASATRVTGIICLGIIGLEWLRHHGWTFSTALKPQAWKNLSKALRTDFLSLIAILASSFGLLSYMLYLRQNFSDPLAFLTVQAAWEREQLGPILILWRDLNRFILGLSSGEGFYWQVLLDVPALFLGLTVGVFVWKRLGASYGLWVFIGLLLPISSATQSLLRYLVVLFPVFMMLGVWTKNKWLDYSLRFVFAGLLGVCFSLFVNWYFVA